MTVAARSVMAMLSVADMERTLAFYRDGLGGELAYRYPGQGEAAFVTMRFGATELGLGAMRGEPLHGRQQRPATGHRIELCFYVDDVDEVVKALAETGAAVVMRPADQPWGERAAYVEDPDGNLVMLVAPLAA